MIQVCCGRPGLLKMLLLLLRLLRLLGLTVDRMQGQRIVIIDNLLFILCVIFLFEPHALLMAGKIAHHTPETDVQVERLVALLADPIVRWLQNLKNVSKTNRRSLHPRFHEKPGKFLRIRQQPRRRILVRLFTGRPRHIRADVLWC
uniref:Secreted protein n=1 Tax=Anopheles darlingi TaxID=43151 RepID=A0A2M4D9I4_ANODA